MLKLAGSLGLAFAMADFRRRMRNAFRSGVLAVCGAAFFLIGLIFLLIAVHDWLSTVLNPAASAAIVGGVLVLIALVFFLLASRSPGEAPASRSADTSPVGDALGDGLSGLGAAFSSEKSPLRNPLFQAAAAAIVAGFLLGRKSKRGKD